MFIRPLRPALAALIAALMSLAFFMAPLAQAQHIDVAADAVCQPETDAGMISGEEGWHDGHHHEAAGCGGCHFHPMNPTLCQAPEIIRSRLTYRLSLSESCDTALPRDLFRPPRS